MKREVKDDLSQLTLREKIGFQLIQFFGWAMSIVYEQVLGEAVWRSSDGTVRTISKMGDAHLVNAAVMLRREKQQSEILKKLEAEASKRGLLRKVNKRSNDGWKRDTWKN